MFSGLGLRQPTYRIQIGRRPPYWQISLLVLISITSTQMCTYLFVWLLFIVSLLVIHHCRASTIFWRFCRRTQCAIPLLMCHLYRNLLLIENEPLYNSTARKEFYNSNQLLDSGQQYITVVPRTTKVDGPLTGFFNCPHTHIMIILLWQWGMDIRMSDNMY